MTRGAALLVLALTGCGVTTAGGDAGPTFTGVDDRLIVGCFGCHSSQRVPWSRGASHALLFDCARCHTQAKPDPGRGHQSAAACTGCHSEGPHRGLACVVCHEPHGTVNLALVRSPLGGGEVRFEAREGRSAKGLVHGDGTGVCERCHTATSHWRADGHGTAHHETSCVECHLHANGFSASAPP